MPYRANMGGGFMPYRRNVSWLPAQTTPVRPLLDKLEFSAGKNNWAFPMRFGLFEISRADMNLISAAMRPS